MRVISILAATALLGACTSPVGAQSIAYHVQGAVQSATGARGDPGLSAHEQMVTTFDGNDTLSFDQSRSSGFGLYSGSHLGTAIAPAGDTGNYAAIGEGGSMLFDLRQFNSPSSVLTSLSVHVGSLDVYNFVDILGLTGTGDIDYDHPLFTVGGSDMASAEGGRDGRLTFSFDDMAEVGAIVFRSTGVAFEFDSLAITTGLPASYSVVAAPVPEPASWAFLVSGFGIIGGVLRSRRMRKAAIV